LEAAILGERHFLSTRRPGVLYVTAPSSGPIFFSRRAVFLGGEAPIHFFDFQEVSALEWAAQNGAIYVALEHRFYGQSNPKPDLTVPSLRYLSSELALADAAVFVDAMKGSDPRFGGAWLVLGCSYSGALSAWFRTKYPHLVVGSVAPSAPVWAVWDFYQFFDNFAQQAPAPCVAATQAATDKMSLLLKTSAGRRTLAAAFNACEPFDSDVDIFNFKYSIVTFLATTAQVGNIATPQCIAYLCDICAVGKPWQLRTERLSDDASLQHSHQLARLRQQLGARLYRTPGDT
jgi:thymus-specific serine protease